jgi:putative RecB family exonuclease
MPVPVPSTLSPSKVSRFTQCPLAFRYSYIDHLPEPATVQQVRGTLVHRALELLFAESGRSREEAEKALERAWSERTDWKEFLELGLDEQAERRLRSEAGLLIDRYYELEDPAAVSVIGLELQLKARLGNVELSGIIDRLDDIGDGNIAVVDYKTGASPSETRSRSSFAGVSFYAVLCEETYGRPPTEVRLIYIRDQVVLVQSVTEQQMRGARQRAEAVWKAISRACLTEDFRPSPSPLCRTCAYREMCPAFAAAAPAVVQSA